MGIYIYIMVYNMTRVYKYRPPGSYSSTFHVYMCECMNRKTYLYYIMYIYI